MPADTASGLPLDIYDADSGKPLLCLLRPGKRPSGVEAARAPRRVVRRLRRHWPNADIAIRGDGHYGTPEVMDALEALGCRYVFGLPGNARLAAIASPWGEDAALRRLDEGTDACRAFFETGYAAKTWTRKRRVIARVDAATDRGVEMGARIELAFPAACPNRAILQTLFTHFAPQPP